MLQLLPQKTVIGFGKVLTNLITTKVKSILSLLMDVLVKTKLETKASSHQGQCIPAGSSVCPPRRVLITP